MRGPEESDRNTSMSFTPKAVDFFRERQVGCDGSNRYIAGVYVCTPGGRLCEQTVKKGGNADIFALLIKRRSSLSEGRFVLQ